MKQINCFFKRLVACLMAVLMIISVVSFVNSDFFSIMAKAASVTVSGRDGSITISNVSDSYSNKVGSFLSDSRWKHGTAWGSRGPKLSTWGSSGCCAYAADFSKYVFEIDNPNGSSQHTSINNIKSGDILYFSQYPHYVVVLKRSGNTLITAEANVGENNGVRVSNSVYSISNGCIYRFGSLYSNTVRVGHYSDVDGGGTEHVHTYNKFYESAHPHKVYMKCSCGDYYYTDETVAYSGCSECMKISYGYVQPVKAYTINTGKTVVYDSVNGNVKSNKIYDTDLCTISQIYNCGWCKVTFPLDAGGTDTGYCKISVFMKGGGFITYTSKQINAYRRSDLSTGFGSTGAGDKIYILGNTSTAVQIAFPISEGGYKVGWVPITALKYTIAYNANGGSGTMSNMSVKYKDSIKLTENKFTRSGYTFSGWNVYRQADSKWYTTDAGWQTASAISSKGYTKRVYKDEFSFTMDKSWIDFGKTNDTFTFYAIWNPNVLSVYYNANGGSINSDTYKLSSNIVYNKTSGEKFCQKWTYNVAKEYGLANAVSTFGLYKTGYTFAGWGTTTTGGNLFKDNDSAIKPTDINANIKNGNCSSTLYAQWKANTYTITYNANGGSGAPSSQTKTYGKNLTLSSTKPTKEGYTFKGWNTKADGSGTQYLPGSSYTSNAAVTLYAQWKANKLTVYYNANGGAIDSDKYKLYSDVAGLISEGSKFSDEWVYNATHKNGLYNASTFGLYKDGYTFTGWGTTASSGKLFDQNDSTVKPTDLNSNIKNGDCSITLYAQWVKNTPISYKVTYIANGGSVSPSSASVTAGSSVKLPTPTKSYTLTYNANIGSGAPSSQSAALTCKGWSTSSSATSASYSCGADFTPSASTTLYAVWNSSASVTLSSTKPTRSGYTFPGWSTSNSATSASYQPGSTITISGNITLFAVWQKNTPAVPVVRDLNIRESVELDYKESYTFTPEITADSGANYIVEWESSNPGTVSVDENGNIYAAKKGNATITCIVTDSQGNIFTDTCEVKVSYNFGQWLIIILLFGWIWY